MNYDSRYKVRNIIKRYKEPVLLTLEEVQRLKQSTDMWIEDFYHGGATDPVVYCGTLLAWSTDFSTMHIRNGNSCYLASDYNVENYGWRIWTSRPSRVQQDKTPWMPKQSKPTLDVGNLVQALDYCKDFGKVGFTCTHCPYTKADWSDDEVSCRSQLIADASTALKDVSKGENDEQ